MLASGVLITTTFAPAAAACLILFQITAALFFMNAGTRITSVERSSSIVLGEASSPSTSRSALCLLLKLNAFAPRTSANFFIVYASSLVYLSEIATAIEPAPCLALTDSRFLAARIKASW